VTRGDTDASRPWCGGITVAAGLVALHLPVPHLADEVAHETFVFAFRHLHEFDLERPFRPWLRGIAWQLVRAELQRFAREQVNRSRLERLQLAELLAQAAQPAPPEEATFIEECLAEIPPHLRRLIEDRYRHERTVREIAVEWGRTEEWVRVTLFRVRRQLRACIQTKLAAGHHAT
jgi:RNA polymerase sigma-70 factor (ECF subfamily)